MLEPRHILDVKKQQIETNLMSLFSQVRESIDNAIGCLGSAETAICQSIVEQDPKINEARRMLEQDCLVAIASQQPVARDLRDIVACMRIATELERIGDYASDIAANVMRMTSTDLSPIGQDAVIGIARNCVHMLDQAATAFQRRDLQKARETAALDDQIDRAQANLIRELFASMQERPEMVPDGSRMLWISHDLERCGDRVTNIAEQTIFMVEGEIMELN